jgi:hypothetical protein
MQARLAKKKLEEQNKLRQQQEATISTVTPTLTKDALQELIREQISYCANKEVSVDYSSLVQSDIEKTNLALDDEALYIRSIVKNQVLHINTEMQFPDIDNMLSFRVVITARSESKDVQPGVDPTTSASVLPTTCNQYTFNIEVPLHYPTQTPSISIAKVTTDHQADEIKQERLKNLLTLNPPVQSMQDMMHLLVTTLVRQSEEDNIKTRISEAVIKRQEEIQERIKKQMEKVGEHMLMDYDTYIEDTGAIIFKNDNGVIRKAKLKSTPPKLESICSRNLAVKTYMYSKDESQLENLLPELNALWYVLNLSQLTTSTLKYEKLVQYFAYSVLRERLYVKIIMEEVPKATLHDMLHKKIKEKTSSEITKALKLGANKRIAIDVAEALEYLHSKNVIHRNVKSTLVFVDFEQAEWRAKLFTDVLHCYFLTGTEVPPGVEPVGQPQYLSPEEFDKESPVTTKTDVFAFGVLLCEIYSQKKPWRDVQSTKIADKVLAGERSPISELTPQPVQVIITECLQQDPTIRPTMSQVVQRLKAL